MRDHLGLTPQQLIDLRERGLPVINVNTRLRVYNEDSVVEWLIARERQRYPKPPRARKSDAEDDLPD